MNYYAIQVKTRSEDQFIYYLNNSSSPLKNMFNIYFLKRAMSIRKNKKIKDSLLPVFPGYVFVETEELTPSIHRFIRSTPGFYRFLPTTQEPKVLAHKDLATVKHFLSFGGIANKSKAHFDENDKIVVSSGPLKGLEGMIVKVDKRKGRAKVKLDMYDDSFLIDLAFEVLDS